MTIHLPKDLEDEIQDEVRLGQFESRDEMVATAVREYLRRKHQVNLNQDEAAAGADSGSLGAMREDADFLDEVVANAMRARRDQPWRLSSGE